MIINIAESAAAQTYLPGLVQGRLTYSNGDPVPSTGGTSTTIYFEPYGGDKINLYDGSSLWEQLDIGSGLSLSLSGYTDGFNYDVWCYNNSGTATLDSTIWTNDTTRATALTLQDGVYVKTGDTTRLYLGTIRMSATGTTSDTLTKRFIWNYYNRIRRSLKVNEATAASHTYSTASWRSYANDATNRLEVVHGVREGFIQFHAESTVDSSNNDEGYIGIGFDSTSVNSANVGGKALQSTGSGAVATPVSASIYSVPNVGYHYYQMIEYGDTGGTVFLDEAPTNNRFHAGMYGEIDG